MAMHFLLILLALIFSAFPNANAEKINFHSLVIHNAWIKETPPNHSITSGYLIIENTGYEDETLISVSSSFAAKVEIHQMMMDENVMKMRQVGDELIIPAGKKIHLEPGGFHLMFVELDMQMIPMRKHPITLTFKDFGTLTIEATVKSFAKSDVSNSKKHKH